jgi:heme exporter protein CcmD
MSGHGLYIGAAYGFTAIVVVALIVWTLLRYRTEKTALAKLEARLGRSD